MPVTQAQMRIGTPVGENDHAVILIQFGSLPCEIPPTIRRAFKISHRPSERKLKPWRQIMQMQWLGCLTLAIAGCLPAQSLPATKDARPCDLAFSAREGFTLKLALGDGQSVYHEGEIVPLEITFTNSGKTDFYATDWLDYCLNPEGQDPIPDYHESGLWADYGALSSSFSDYNIPHVVNEELNEWKSLLPGKYSLRVVSRLIPAVSNEVSFQVVPATPEWQARQLADALALLHADQEEMPEFEGVRARHAIKILRYLGSEASTRDLAQRFWSHSQKQSFTFGTSRPPQTYPISLTFAMHESAEEYWDFKAGLIGSPSRALAIKALSAAVGDPHHPATLPMVETLALLEIQSNPKYPRFLPYDSNHPAEREEQRKVKGEAYNNLLATLLKRISEPPK